MDLEPAGEEQLRARCTGDGCDRRWQARGTIGCQQASARAQKHANRTGHVIDLEWTNRRRIPALLQRVR